MGGAAEGGAASEGLFTMRVKLRCPNCGQVLMVRKEEIGTTGRCPKCKQDVALERPSAAPAVSVQPAADDSVPVAELIDAGAPSPPPPANADHSSNAQPVAFAEAAEDDLLSVAVLEDDQARAESGIRGAVAVTRKGPAPLGKPRSPAVVVLLGMFVPGYFFYWIIATRSEIRAHQGLPDETGGQFFLRLLRFVGLYLVTLGFYAPIYCYYTIPKRIAAIQAKGGNPSRISPTTCLLLLLVPYIGAILSVAKIQSALTGHWAWMAQRGDTSVTSGLVG